MPPHGSVTHWINLLQAGDHAAVRPLWERYFGQLVLRARAALRGKANLGADAEDVTLSAFDNFCRPFCRTKGSASVTAGARSLPS